MKNLMYFRSTFFRSLVSAFIVLLMFASQGWAKDKITIGLIPEMNVFKQKKRFDPLARYLSKELDLKVELSILSRYGNLVERFKEQKFDGAFLGSFTGALAIKQLGIIPLARPVNNDGTSTYLGYIFARNDSGINGAADMRGKTIAFVERATTAGYIFPLAYLKRNNVVDLDGYLNGYFFAGSHDAAIQSVMAGTAQVGAAKNTIYDRLRSSNPRIDRDLHIIAKSPRVPSNGLCVRPDMIAPLKERILQSLLSLEEDAEGRVVLNVLGAKRFVKTTLEDYKPVFELAEEAGISIDSYEYVNK